MYDNATSEKASLLQQKSDESPYLQIKEKEYIGEDSVSKEGTSLWGNRLLVVVCILLTELCERLTLLQCGGKFSAVLYVYTGTTKQRCFNGHSCFSQVKYKYNLYIKKNY